MSDFDVVVVGSGIIGSWTALQFQRRGQRVLLLDQHGRGHGIGSSHGASRIIRRTYTQQHFADLMPEAYDEWQRLEAHHQTQLLVTTGGLMVGEGTSLDVVEQTSGRPRMRHAELCAKFPSLRFPDTYEAVYEADAGVLRADKCLRAVQESFTGAHGGTYWDECKVMDVSEDASGSHVTVTMERLSESRMTVGARVQPRRVVRAGQVVLALGGWLGTAVRRWCGVTLDLRVQKVHVCYWPMRDETEAQVYSVDKGFPVFIDYHTPHVYALPALEYPRLFKVCLHAGPTLDHGADERDHRVDDSMVATVAAYIERHMPRLSSTPEIVDTCLYTWTGDTDAFLIDTVPGTRRIHMAGGGSGHAFKLSPVIGRLAADLVLSGREGAHATPLEHFRVNHIVLSRQRSKI